MNPEPSKVEEAIIFSAKHVGLWDEDMSKRLIEGKITNLYLNVPALTERFLALLKEERAKELARIAPNLRNSLDLPAYLEKRIKELLERPEGS